MIQGHFGLYDSQWRKGKVTMKTQVSSAIQPVCLATTTLTLILLCSFALGSPESGLVELTGEVGNAEKAAITIKEGKQTLHLEIIPNMVIVRGLDGKPPASLREAESLGGNPGTQMSWLKLDKKGATAQAALSAGQTLDAQVRTFSDVTFSGPVMKLADKVMGAGDTINVKFAPEVTEAQARAFFEGLGLVVTYDKAKDINLWTVRLATTDGNDTILLADWINDQPGVEWASPDWYSLRKPDGEWTDSFGGTSSACPAVSGVAALVLSANPNLTYKEVFGILESTADRIDPDYGYYGGTSKHSIYYGYGRVNAKSAVEKASGTSAGAAVDLNDPLLPYQWHLDHRYNYLDDTAGVISEDADMRCPEAWSLTQGSPNCIIGIIDSGFDMAHPDLNFKAGYDPVSEQPSEVIPDFDGPHGTSVAGVIAAIGNNGIGGAGVAPAGLPIVGVRAIGYATTDQQMFDAFKYCVDQGAWIINNSWGWVYDWDFCTSADDNVEIPMDSMTNQILSYCVNQGRGGKGCVVTFSAGNSRAKVDKISPQNDDRVLCVAASNNKARRSAYSNYGAVDVCAPSDDVDIEYSCGKYTVDDGCVSGISSSCFNNIWLGGTLGIVTSEVGGFMEAQESLGFSDLSSIIPFYDVSGNTIYIYPVKIGSDTYYAWPVEDRKGNLSAVVPFLQIDSSGTISGELYVTVKNSLGMQLASGFLPVVSGRAKFAASGNTASKIKYAHSASIKAKGTLGGAPASVSLSFAQKWVWYPGNYYSGKDYFWGNSAVSIRGVTSAKMAGGFIGEVWDQAAFKVNTITPRNSKNSSWVGDAIFLSNLQLTRGGVSKASVRFPNSKTGKPGAISISFANGKCKGAVKGLNYWANTGGSGYLWAAEPFFTPNTLSIRKANASTSMKYPAE